MTPFEAALAKRIADEIELLRSNLEQRGTVQNIEDFRFLTGRIFSLRLVVDSYFDEVNEDLNKEK